MSIKPRNFDKKIEIELMQQGLCTQEILKKYSIKEKRYFFNLYYIGAIGRRKHPYDEYAFTVYSSERRKIIPQAARFDEMKMDIPLIKKVCNYVAGKWPNGYVVTNKGREIFSKCCIATKKGCGLVDSNNQSYNPPRNGIRSIMEDGRKCKFNEKVRSEIMINEFSLRRLVSELVKSKKNQHMINQGEILLAIANASKSGGIPMTYTQSKGGRFYAEGAVNLQNCSRELRKAALVGHYDIDIENCHYCLLEQMCKRIDIPTPHITHYIKNKKLMRRKVADMLGCSEEMAKEVLIALIYGSNLTNYGVLNKLDFKNDEIDISGSWIDNLAKEISKVSKYVVNNFMNRSPGHFKIINDAGMTKSTKIDKDKNVKKSKLLAFILQGAESLILEHMIRFIGDNIVLLQHDGVTCNHPIHIDALSDHIYNHTGYRVKFEMTKLTMDLSYNGLNICDFMDKKTILDMVV